MGNPIFEVLDPENAVEKRYTPAPQPESDEEFDGEEGHSIEGEDEMNFKEQAEMMANGLGNPRNMFVRFN